MTRKPLQLFALLAILLSSSNAFAGVWFELLHAPCWSGKENNLVDDDGVMGHYRGSVDCFNKDFNGGGSRTTLTIKAFQAWEFGTMFMYYDITGPFNSAIANTSSANEKGGFFGGITVTLSGKYFSEKLMQRQLDWGPLANVSLKYEAEHVAKFGMLSYYGVQWDLAVPFMDFVSATTVIRDDYMFRGVDLQVGLAWQKSFALGSQDFKFLGFFQAGLFGEGVHRLDPTQKGNRFFLAQPELLWDFGKVITFTPDKLLVGVEYQLAFNRYLIQNKTENVLQGMIRWNI
ncbi:hypothetical protein [Vitiosangium sp. GDMCC 1.1324]|uniref:hypothetical protein n=1 Tax=Vitiosangium sp. (strain GDMCC 1.1324) TaxID=2138576 RepID=UPI000D37A592|nr:hypothetical protein [Vitiosangium sp. GDMCC 1.1324]PTL75228.1 hypothetical protein DAT35_55815 [Vitiosangium sp. GDMCC 1.1324]